jgi:hypothetical protein
MELTQNTRIMIHVPVEKRLTTSGANHLGVFPLSSLTWFQNQHNYFPIQTSWLAQLTDIWHLGKNDLDKRRPASCRA